MPDERSPMLSSFAQQVEALREQRLPAKVGVLLPTFNRPDLLRSCVLQFAAQSRPPDVICVHQNGVADSYEWAVEDLQIPVQLKWLHTNAQLSQHEWYSIPLQHLVDAACSHFFWADHGDLYLRDHVEKGVEALREVNFVVPRRGALLVTQARDYRYAPDFDFAAQSPSGIPGGMCFDRRFARQLLADLAAAQSHVHTSDVIAQVTCPKFRCKDADARTVVRHPSGA